MLFEINSFQAQNRTFGGSENSILPKVKEIIIVEKMPYESLLFNQEISSLVNTEKTQ